MKIVETDLATYNTYVKAGKWQPLGEVKWYKNRAGIVKAVVDMKGGYTKELDIIIVGYFPQTSR